MTQLLSKTIKTEKTEKAYPDWINTLTYLYPNKNLCKFSENCFSTCLKTSGRLPMSKKAMITRTKLLYQDNVTFIENLESELRKAKKSAHKKGNKGYSLTFSFDGLNHTESKYLLDNHIANVSIVLTTKREEALPDTYNLDGTTYPVLDGDKHDLRFTEKTGFLIGLRAKGKAIKNNGSFVQPTK